MTKQETDVLAHAIHSWNEYVCPDGITRDAEPIYLDAIHMLARHIKSGHRRFDQDAFIGIATGRKPKVIQCYICGGVPVRVCSCKQHPVCKDHTDTDNH